MDIISKNALASINNSLISEEDIDLKTEDDILNFIEFRVGNLLDRSPELLMSYMYRLDIAEHKIQTIFKFKATEPIARQLAKLIWTRQKQRVKSKMDHKKGNPNFWYD